MASYFLILGTLLTSRHLGPRRVWNVGSEQSMRGDPVDPLEQADLVASSKKPQDAAMDSTC